VGENARRRGEWIVRVSSIKGLGTDAVPQYSVRFPLFRSTSSHGLFAAVMSLPAGKLDTVMAAAAQLAQKSDRLSTILRLPILDGAPSSK
jgi:hypothetical protein